MQKSDLKSLEIVRAARLVPLSPDDSLLSDGAVLVDGVGVVDGRGNADDGPGAAKAAGTVMAVGRYADFSRDYPSAPVRDLGDVTLVPGLLNAHCHLGLSALRGGIEPGLGFLEWLRRLIVHPKRMLGDTTTEAIREAVGEMRRSGTCFVADIASHCIDAVAGVLQDSGFFFVCFQEHILFAPPGAEARFVPDGRFDRGVYSAAGHALYSTHPDILRRAKAETRKLGLPFSLHLAEMAEETDDLMGQSTWYADILDKMGLSHDGFRVPRCSPVEYARDLGLLDEATLAVHCVTVDDRDIAILRETGASVCLCPRSNDYITGGRAPWEKLLAAGVNCCLGTDSLASNRDLDLWNELRFMKERYQGPLSLEQGLAMMTANPARVMGMDRLGAIKPGKAAFFATVPRDIEAMFPQS